MSEQAGRRSVVITGAARGIGRAIAACLHVDGWVVVGVDQDEGVAEAVGIVAVVGDVADPRTNERAADVAEGLAPLRGWVNNAGYNIVGAVHEIAPAEYERGMAVNLGGAFWGTAAAVRRMLANGGGSIVNMSSAQADFGFPRRAAYAASKGAIASLTRQVAAEFVRRGVRCNAIAPGVVSTPMVELEIAEAQDPVAARRAIDVLAPIGRRGTPEDIARAARFLLSDDASFITGQVLVVDGGHAVVPANFGLET
jgi:NAD(P)-dependent dehydrogenase (short-subunit alcohol dehydrogenase family)